MSETILITGGGGFIGTHLAERLSDDHQVVLFDSFRRDSLSATRLGEHPNVRVVQGDVLDREAVRQASQGAGIVLHLAAVAGVSSYYRIPLETLQVNILGTVNVLDAAVAAGVRRFLHFSTSEVYGTQAIHVDEDASHAIGPTSDQRWVYATSKLASENFVLRYGEHHDFAATCVRPFNVYGPRQTGEGAISNFCAAAVGGEPLVVYGDGSAIRAWCYISDMVDAVVRILATPESAGHSINIGNPREVETTSGLARRIRALVPGASIRYREIDRSEVAVRIPSIEKARRILDIEPQIDLDEGLQHTLAWYQERAAS